MRESHRHLPAGNPLGPPLMPFRGDVRRDRLAHLPRWLLMRVLAYRLQSNAFGDLDKSIRRNLRSEKDDRAGVPFDRRAPQTRQGVALKAGAFVNGRAGSSGS